MFTHFSRGRVCICYRDADYHLLVAMIDRYWFGLIPTLKPSSWEQAYTEAVLPTPGGPVISMALHRGSSLLSAAPASPWKSPQSHESAQEDSYLFSNQKAVTWEILVVVQLLVIRTPKSKLFEWKNIWSWLIINHILTLKWDRQSWKVSYRCYFLLV